jgi:hypothetical protein
MRIPHIPSVFHKETPFIPITNTIEFDFTFYPWKSSNIPEKYGFHTFTDDRRFESLWRQPYKSLKYAIGSQCILTPDFTFYKNSPIMVAQWQLYRSLAVGGFWQSYDITVIQSVNWSTPEQIELSTQFYPVSKYIAVRCPGKKYYDDWIKGAEIIKKIMKPQLVLHFGTHLGMDVWDDAINVKLRRFQKVKDFLE